METLTLTKRISAGIVLLVCAPVFTGMPACACSTAVRWSADLDGKSLTPAVQTAASGTAVFAFDFDHPAAMLDLTTSGVTDVQKAELQVRVRKGATTESFAIPLYTAGAEPLTASLHRDLSDTDIPATARAKGIAMADIANAVLAHAATVTVFTAAHPAGEISGVIVMHKYTLYNDDPNSKGHDPALHKKAETAKPG